MSDLVLFVHILGVLAFAGGAAAAGLAFEAARRRQSAAEIAALLGVARSGAALLGGGGLTLLVAGLWLVDLEDVGYGSGWVVGALVLFLAAMVVGGLAGRRPKQARLLAARLAEEGRPVSEELRALLEDPVSRAANYAAAAAVVAILALMVFKPG
jgi:uncharacterized membrane protein